MSFPKDQKIIDFFKKQNGVETKVELKNGTIISIWNIVWGYDIGDEYAHITSNISPTIDNSTIDFFYTSDIKNIFSAEDIVINL